MSNRYNVAKTIEMLLVQELAAQVSASSKPKLTINNVNPGYVATDVMRQAKGISAYIMALMAIALARTPEVGSRTMVHGAEGGADTHGAYLSDCKHYP